MWPQDHFGPTLTLAPSILRPEAHFSSRNTLVLIILRPNAYFGLEILWPKTTSAQYTLAREPNFQYCHFAPSKVVPQGEIKAIIINIIRPVKKIGKLALQRQTSSVKPFSIKVHFLIWSYQACNYSYKLVSCMATNLILYEIKLLKLSKVQAC